MAGGDIIAPQLPRTVQQVVKFQVAVAINAGVGGAAVLVDLHKFADDFFVKLFRKIQHIVGHAQVIGNGTGILHIVQ